MANVLYKNYGRLRVRLSEKDKLRNLFDLIPNRKVPNMLIGVLRRNPKYRPLSNIESDDNENVLINKTANKIIGKGIVINTTLLIDFTLRAQQ